MLEKLVHWNGHLPPNQHSVEITIPTGTSYEVFSAEHHPDWFRPDGETARRYGHGWYDQCRSLLVVPSVIARMEENLLINPAHPDAAASGRDWSGRCGGTSGCSDPDLPRHARSMRHW